MATILGFIPEGSYYRQHIVRQRFEATEMSVQKQNLPSFSTFISILSVVLCCAGFLRVELELGKYNSRIMTLETREKSKQEVSDPGHILSPNYGPSIGELFEHSS